jgi:hypothetical protein
MKPSTPKPDPVEEIRQLYYKTTGLTVQRDLTRAIELFKSLETTEQRERAAVFMDGLSQMRSEWTARSRNKNSQGRGRFRKSTKPTR